VVKSKRRSPISLAVILVILSMISGALGLNAGIASVDDPTLGGTREKKKMGQPFIIDIAERLIAESKDGESGASGI
jgi:hypothetical protein